MDFDKSSKYPLTAVLVETGAMPVPTKSRNLFSKIFNYYTKIFGFPTFTQSTYCCHAWPNYQNGPNRRIHVPKCGLLTNCIYNWGKIEACVNCGTLNATTLIWLL